MLRGRLYGFAFVAMGVMGTVVEPGAPALVLLAGGAVFVLFPGVQRGGTRPAGRLAYLLVALVLGVLAVGLSLIEANAV